MKEIILHSGAVAIVDDEDYNLVCNHVWCEHRKKHTSYAIRSEYTGGKKISIYMHRIILNARVGQLVDHINGNGLDNRRNNIRIASKMANAQNRQNPWGSSKYLGVSFARDRNVWTAQIQVEKKYIHLGGFDREEDAAYAYNIAAMKYFGEFAHLNELPPGDYSAVARVRSSKYQRRKQNSWGLSKYFGVSWRNERKKWVAHVNINGKKHYVGQFDSEEDAHTAQIEFYKA